MQEGILRIRDHRQNVEEIHQIEDRAHLSARDIHQIEDIDLQMGKGFHLFEIGDRQIITDNHQIGLKVHLSVERDLQMVEEFHQIGKLHRVKMVRINNLQMVISLGNLYFYFVDDKRSHTKSEKPPLKERTEKTRHRYCIIPRCCVLIFQIRHYSLEVGTIF